MTPCRESTEVQKPENPITSLILPKTRILTSLTTLVSCLPFTFKIINFSFKTRKAYILTAKMIAYLLTVKVLARERNPTSNIILTLNGKFYICIYTYTV